MKDQFVTGNTGNQPRCVVCDVAVSMIDARRKASQGYIVCHSFECQRIMKQKPAMNSGFFQRLVATQRRVVQATIARNVAENERVEKLQDRESNENRQARQFMESRHPELPEQTHLINLPSGLSKLTTLSESRIEKYESHLKKNIGLAAELKDGSEVTDFIELKEKEKCSETERRLDRKPELRIISDQMCGVCKGGCCVLGGDHAFNSFSTMRRFMDANPTMTEEEVLDAYLSRIEPETVESSCINQTKFGCGLPREMRSDTCNGFYCNEIKSYHRDFANSSRKVEPLITVQRTHTLWDRWAPDANHDIVAIQLVDVEQVETLEVSEVNTLDSES